MKRLTFMIMALLLTTPTAYGAKMVKVQKVKRIYAVAPGPGLLKVSNGDENERRVECLQVTGLLEGSSTPASYLTCACKDLDCLSSADIAANVKAHQQMADRQLSACETNVKLVMLRPGQLGIDLAGWCPAGDNLFRVSKCWALNACELEVLETE